MALHTSLLDRLKSQHESIPALLSRVDADRLLLRPLPGKWNIKDNLAHLARYQPVFDDRLDQILKVNSPVFGRYKAEDDPEFETWRSLNVEKLIENLRKDRKKLIERIIAFDDKELTRTGIHPKYGRMAITQWVEFFLLHESHHIFTMFRIANDTEL